MIQNRSFVRSLLRFRYCATWYSVLQFIVCCRTMNLTGNYLDLIKINLGTTSPKRYFVDDAVITGIGEVVLVCNQWKKELMPKFIENADKLGYSIKQI